MNPSSESVSPSVSSNPLLDVIKQELKPEHVAGTIAEKIINDASTREITEYPQEQTEKVEASPLPGSDSEQEEAKEPPTLDALADLLLNQEKEKPEVKIAEPEEETEEESEPVDEVEALIAKGPKESIKNLRERSKELKKLLDEKEATLSQLQGEVERFRSGDGIPEEIKEQYEGRIKQLEQYERLHALKLSREYQTKFIEPGKKLKAEAEQIAKEYGVQPEIFNKALQIDNKRELNSYLRNYFDDVGALEARDIVQKIKELKTEAARAEQEPGEALSRIQQEVQAREQQEAQARISRIVNTAKTGWQHSLTELTSSGEYPELMIKPNDENHNKVVRPIVESAAQEYGKFIKLLGEAGIKDLPEEATKILAKRFQLSQAASVMAASRASHYSRAEELLNETRKRESLTRPPIGASSDGGGRGQIPKGPSSPEEAADLLISKVLGKR